MFDFCPGDCNEPITARDILEGYGLPDGVVDEALVAHAHELSVLIRARLEPETVEDDDSHIVRVFKEHGPEDVKWKTT